MFGLWRSFAICIFVLLDALIDSEMSHGERRRGREERYIFPLFLPNEVCDFLLFSSSLVPHRAMRVLSAVRVIGYLNSRFLCCGGLSISHGAYAFTSHTGH